MIQVVEKIEACIGQTAFAYLNHELIYYFQAPPTLIYQKRRGES